MQASLPVQATATLQPPAGASSGHWHAAMFGTALVVDEQAIILGFGWCGWCGSVAVSCVAVAVGSRFCLLLHRRLR